MTQVTTRPTNLFMGHPFRFTTTVREYLDPGFLVPAMEIFDSKFVQPRTHQR